LGEGKRSGERRRDRRSVVRVWRERSRWEAGEGEGLGVSPVDGRVGSDYWIEKGKASWEKRDAGETK
jgi:hypothetical protein